jgi:hypothetical protein
MVHILICWKPLKVTEKNLLMQNVCFAFLCKFSLNIFPSNEFLLTQAQKVMQVFMYSGSQTYPI